MESFWRVVGLSHETGDTQLAVFNLETQEVLISYSYITKEMKKPIEAYRRSPIYVDMKKLWQPF